MAQEDRAREARPQPRKTLKPRQPLQLSSGEAPERVMRWKVPHEGPVTDADLPKTDKQRHTIPTQKCPRSPRWVPSLALHSALPALVSRDGRR